VRSYWLLAVNGELGLGDDQDADGAETGYKVWEPLVWKALGVASVEAHEAEPEPITNEHIKAASSRLRGTIAEGLEDTSTGALAASDTQLTKFHGIYQQDDRDIRDEREAQGVEVAYSFMIRVRLPGGVCTPAQWLAMDQIADEDGSGTSNFQLDRPSNFMGSSRSTLSRRFRPSAEHFLICRRSVAMLIGTHFVQTATGQQNRLLCYQECPLFVDSNIIQSACAGVCVRQRCQRTPSA
jgi:hypothetical protein